MTTTELVLFGYTCADCGHAGQAHPDDVPRDGKPAYCDSCGSPVTLELTGSRRPERAAA